ncbi:hypothetical protein [uncultured Flavobacterium sp.]|uniref:hypothetical protein n=1 Tax=uncultured Flavobacterium sp. TaxID=165435 RepID=UPI0030EDC921|tara:strand:+ start:2142 stop:2840 length:699 start_codon:yes stop_codon:yes gene_type:complete
MKLAQPQIENLYQFTQKHYVEWYDLQTELVDHLANAIEEQWQQNPKLSFEDALQIEFKKFGVFGFMDVVEKRQASLNKKYNKIVWNHFKEFFTIPKIFASLTFIGLLFYVLNLNFYQSEILLISFSFCVFSFLGIIVFRKIKNKKHNIITGKKWLFKEIIFNYSSFAGMFYLPIQFLLNTDKIIQTELGILFISILIISMLLVEYIILFQIPSKAEQYLKETYPEYEFANTL